MAPKVAILKIFKPHLLPNSKSRFSQNLVGDIWATRRFRIAKNILLRYPQWLPQQPFLRSSIVSSAALLQVNLCPGLLTMVSASSVCQSVTFHIFDIYIRIVSIMAAMAAILKVFNCYLLPNSKSDGAKT